LIQWGVTTNELDKGLGRTWPVRTTIRLLRTNWWYLTAAMVVLAVLAAGVHTMTIATPALAEQERLARTADAEAERAVVPNPAAADGMPVPALLGGIVLAFAVGLSAGQIQRRRRAARRSTVAKERPAPAPTPSVPARPAPPPPEPVVPEPKPVEIAAAAPPAPPPPPAPAPAPVRSHGPRILRFRAAPPPPPEPVVDEDEVVAPADEIVEAPADEIVEAPADEIVEAPADEIVEAPADEIVEAPADEIVEAPADEIVEHEVVEAAPDAIVPEAEPTGPLGVAPEVPQRDERPSAPASPTAPVSGGPEALRRPEPVVPARRFARARPWPKEAETLWTCEIAWKAGYLKSTFRAMAGPPGAGRRKSIGESPSLRWTLMTDPEPPTPEMIASVKALVSALVAAGWERTGTGAAWYAQRFVWRGSGEPRAIAVPSEIETAP
jgi:hypothetical protein